MNTGLLTGIRNKQPAWWGDQDAGAKNLLNVGIISTGPSPASSLVVDPFGVHIGLNSDFILGEVAYALRIDGQNIIDTTTSPGQGGISAVPSWVANANITGIFGILFQPIISGSGTITNVYPGWFKTICSAPVTNAWGQRIEFQEAVSTVGTFVGLDVYSTLGLGGTITTAIGLRITGLNGSTVWGMQIGNYQSYHQGPLMVGDASAPATSAGIELKSTTKALLVSRMTTAQKNALTAVNGMILYDSDLGKFQGYQAGSWQNMI